MTTRPACRAESWTVRDATIVDAAAVADLDRLAFATQSGPTNPPPGGLKETAATPALMAAAEGEARRQGLARLTAMERRLEP